MKSSHGTDFSRMMRAMRGPQVGFLTPRTPHRSFALGKEEDLGHARLSNEVVTTTRAATVFLRRFSTEFEDVNVGQPGRAYRADDAQVNQIKSELAKLLEEEIKDSQGQLDYCNAFLSRTGFKLRREPDGRILMHKSLGKLTVKVWFNSEDVSSEDEDEEEEEEEGKIQEWKPGDKIPGLEWDVVVQMTLVDKSNKELSKLTLSCVAEREKLFIRTMHSADGNSTMEFDELSDQLQWKIYEYLEALQVDNDLAQFILDYASHAHDHKNVAVLKDLKLTLLS